MKNIYQLFVMPSGKMRILIVLCYYFEPQNFCLTFEFLLALTHRS